MRRVSFCDNWIMNGKSVAVPHDAMIHEVRNGSNPSGSAQAYFPGGKYVYEKEFDAPVEKHVLLQFEGVYKNSKVFINGKEAGGCDSGYFPFYVCADEFLVKGKNTIRVECENVNQPDSRWYTGAGIYRPVWMWVGSENSILPEQVKVHTVSINPTTIHVYTGCEDACIEILDSDTVIAKAKGAEIDIVVPDGKLWSENNPYLYKCRVSNSEDSSEVSFGIRTITWDNKGFYVNGKSTLLKGGCIHHDNGILGAATWDESEYRRAKKLKEAGFNAIRSAHNPTSRAMLEACDKLGIYVMDETWDMWFHHKSKFDYAGSWRKNYLNDIKALVERDYNHPSVVMYSIGNEVSEPAKDEGVEKTKEMVAYLHELDGSRPVTGGFNLMIIANAKKGKGVYNEDGGMANDNSKKMEGMNSTMFNFITNLVGTGMNKSANSKQADEATSPCLDALDMAGYNYASGRYPMEGKAHPDRLIYGSETFPQDIAKNWKMVKEYPYLIGDFMWTAWDYIGEVGLGAWAYTKDGTGFDKPYPWLLADTGVFDITGEPNGELFLAQAAWGTVDKPLIGIQPVNHPGVRPAKMAWRGTNAIASWSWDNCVGNKAIVEVYVNADYVELRLNDKSVGKKKVKDCKAEFKMKYMPGTLMAIAYDSSGKEISRNELVSATGKKSVSVVPEVKVAKANEVVYVNVAIVGENGIVESNADRELSVSVTGGELLGFGSANPRTEERFDTGKYRTYYGKALAVIRVGESGTALVKVTDKDTVVKTEIAIQ